MNLQLIYEYLIKMEKGNMAEWVTAIGTIVLAIATIVLAYTVVIAWSQMKADHERSRRERAVELILEWAKSLSPKASSARKFAETLDQKQSIALFKQEEIEVDEKSLSLLVACLDEEIKPENKKIRLTAKQVAQIRWEVISYLNKLEAILSAWRHNIADKEMITEQFKYLIKPEDGHTLLEEFIKASSNSYPAITEFAEHLKSQETAKDGKPKIA